MKCAYCNSKADELITFGVSGFSNNLCSSCKISVGLEDRAQCSYCGSIADKQVETRQGVIIKLCNNCEWQRNETLQIH
ncbi:MAG TPA: hypothetical protein VJB94_02345 [Candidatus Nanoarchaeia archaeon]|nr:hypothetical protein [Candidatus Nanoarchaeia archaeon]